MKNTQRERSLTVSREAGQAAISIKMQWQPCLPYGIVSLVAEKFKQHGQRLGLLGHYDISDTTVN